MYEVEDSKTNVELELDVDQTPQHEDNIKSQNEEARRDSSRDSDLDDDEYLVSDNDDLYDNYVDDNEEWVRIRGK